MSPKVYCISRPSFDADGLEDFLKDRGLSWARDPDAAPAECSVEAAGRVCYMSFKSDTSRIRYPNASYIAHLIDQGHESVLEHVTWTVILDNVSRAFTHQLVRHRPGFAYSQLSQQYHDESDAEFVKPVGLDEVPGGEEAWTEAVGAARLAYQNVLKLADDAADALEDEKENRRWFRSTARSLLPNATATTITVTANARSWRHFLSVRGAIEGDYEMRQVSALLLDLFAKDAPALFADFENVIHKDGHPMVTCRKGTA